MRPLWQLACLLLIAAILPALLRTPVMATLQPSIELPLRGGPAQQGGGSESTAVLLPRAQQQARPPAAAQTQRTTQRQQPPAAASLAAAAVQRRTPEPRQTAAPWASPRFPRAPPSLA